MHDVDILIRAQAGATSSDYSRALINSIWRTLSPSDLVPHRFMITYVQNGGMGRFDIEVNENTHDTIQYVYLPTDTGSPHAINVGLALATLSPAPYILLMDNDTEIPAGDKTWLDRWIKMFDDESVGAVGAVTDYVAGMQQCEAVPDLYQRDWKVEGEGEGFKMPPAVPALVSFAVMLRKKAVLQTGYFDERFSPKNFEDYDYTLRMREKGWKLVVANSVWIHHRGQNKTSAMQSESMRDNERRFVEKWGIEKLRAMGLAK